MPSTLEIIRESYSKVGPTSVSDSSVAIKKTIQNSIENLLGFLVGSWAVFTRFWDGFGTPGPSKTSVSPRRSAIFQKITFFNQMRFWVDF